jgi:hypothetical protein
MPLSHFFWMQSTYSSLLQIFQYAGTYCSIRHCICRNGRTGIQYTGTRYVERSILSSKQDAYYVQQFLCTKASHSKLAHDCQDYFTHDLENKRTTAANKREKSPLSRNKWVPQPWHRQNRACALRNRFAAHAFTSLRGIIYMATCMPRKNAHRCQGRSDTCLPRGKCLTENFSVASLCLACLCP